MYSYFRCCGCCCRRRQLIIIVRSSCLRSKERFNNHHHQQQQSYPLQIVFIEQIYSFRHPHQPVQIVITILVLIHIRMFQSHLQHPFLLNVINIKNRLLLIINNNSNSNSNSSSSSSASNNNHDDRIIQPNIFSAIFVVAVLIYVRAHVNVAFHRIYIIMNKIHRNLIDKIAQVYHRLLPPIIVVNSSIDFLLSTEHFSRSLTQTCCSLTLSQRDRFLPKFAFTCFIFIFLLPLTMSSSAAVSTPTQLTTSNRQVVLLFDDWNSSTIRSLLIRKPQWHAGCCIKSKKASLAVCDISSLNSTLNVLESNIFIEMSAKIDFLNNETLFCERYEKFRHLSSKPLATFTYTIFVVGILLNTFVFLVLMCGSLRRSTSFVLFLALTCFDLLSLASSLFSSLFRTVMTSLSTSPLFCKLFSIFFLYFRQCSSSTLLLIAIERCIVIKYHFVGIHSINFVCHY